MSADHAIILPVIVPALAAVAALMVASKSRILPRAVSLGAQAALLALAAYNIEQAGQGPQAYVLGNWPAPFGIALLRDGLAALMLALVAALSAAVTLYAIATNLDARGRYFHPLMLFQIMGLNGAFLTADAFNLFVFFEVLLIASYGLLLHGGGGERVRAGLQYLVINLAGSAIFLIGLAVIYAQAGTLNIADLARKLPALPATDAGLIRLGAVLLFTVFAMKAALVPLQFWLPRSYHAAPAPIAALFAVMTKLGAYAAIRFGALVYPATLTWTAGLWGEMMLAAGLASIALGALGVLAARQLRQMIGFAIIASMGTIFVAAAPFTPAATSAALYYTLSSTLSAAALFLLADQIILRRGGDDFAALAPQMPHGALLGGAFVLAAMAMAGLPPMPGFIGKVMILQASASASANGSAGVWAAILIGTFVGMIGFVRAGSALFWRHSAGDLVTARAPSAPPPLAPLAVPLAMIAALIALSVFAGPISDFLARIAAQVLVP